MNKEAVNKRLAILMATYNGESYISEQIESILSQTYRNWTLYVKDDLSMDSTLSIVRKYAAIDDRIVLLDSVDKCGAKGNFTSMMEGIDADYYMFSDQDDVWLPNKVEKSISALQELEAKYPNLPLIVHTDLKVVNESLSTICPSLWQMFRIEPSLLNTFDRLGGHCLVTGCTMAFNKKAKSVSLPMSDAAIMHDVWMALKVYKEKGIIEYISDPTILYRQHGHNTLGAKDFRYNYVLNKFKRLRGVIKENISYYRMLSALSFGSPLKFLYYKIWYYFAYNRKQDK